VQNNQSKGHLQKLTYQTQGPHNKVTKLTQMMAAMICNPSNHHHTSSLKAHSIDLYPCPELLKPFPHLKSSDYQFGNINKVGITPNPYKFASISDFQPTTPWTAPAAYTDIVMELSPSLTQMDVKYGSWPKSGNPFTHVETAFATGHKHKAPTLTNGYTNIVSSDQATLVSL
jgi:hypothetical protein